MYVQDPTLGAFANPYHPAASPVNPYMPPTHTFGASWFTPRMFQPMPQYFPTMNIPPNVSALSPQNPFIVPNLTAGVPPIYGQVPPIYGQVPPVYGQFPPAYGQFPPTNPYPGSLMTPFSMLPPHFARF